MKLKSRAADFRVRELLTPDVLTKKGEHRVYRVLKRKLTSLEAAEVLAQEAGRGAGEISMCGLKDRQGVTTQYMSIRHGPEVSVSGSDVKIETVGFATEPLESRHSEGNAFELNVRGLRQDDIAALRTNLPRVRKQGVVNYFDEQRFGNLRHGQGWIALDLMRGDAGRALKMLVAARSLHDDPRSKTLKAALRENWGDWGACRDIAGKLGAHHSVFEHLRKHPEDPAGAFFHVGGRIRLIHLYAYQSHVWNRAVADFVREHVPLERRIVVDSEEGPLVYPDERELLPVPADATFRLPGPGLEDVIDPVQRGLLADVLAADRISPAQFRIEGVSGMALKGEDRPLFVVPQHLRVRPPKPDPNERGALMVGVRFELPRGAYATLVTRRLFEAPGRAPLEFTDGGGELPRERGERRSFRAPEGDERPRRPRQDDRGGYARDDRRGPPRDDRRGPPRDDRRGPPRFDSERPPRAPRFERDGGPGRFERGPARGFDRGPARGFDRGPRDDRPPQPWRERSGPPRDDRPGRFERAPDRPPRRPRADGPPPRAPRKPRGTGFDRKDKNDG